LENLLLLEWILGVLDILLSTSDFDLATLSLFFFASSASLCSDERRPRSPGLLGEGPAELLLLGFFVAVIWDSCVVPSEGISACSRSSMKDKMPWVCCEMWL